MSLPTVRRVGPVDSEREQAETILERPVERKQPVPRRPTPPRRQSIVNNLIMAALAGRVYESPSALEEAVGFVKEREEWDQEKRGDIEDALRVMAREVNSSTKDVVMMDLFQKLNRV